jgi:hypothetical protein
MIFTTLIFIEICFIHSYIKYIEFSIGFLRRYQKAVKEEKRHKIPFRKNGILICDLDGTNFYKSYGRLN